MTKSESKARTQHTPHLHKHICTHTHTCTCDKHWKQHLFDKNNVAVILKLQNFQIAKRKN